MLIELYSYATVIVITLMVVISSLRILREYERGVVFLLGRFWKVKGPGLVIVIPIIQSMWCGLICVPGSWTCPNRT